MVYREVHGWQEVEIVTEIALEAVDENGDDLPGTWNDGDAHTFVLDVEAFLADRAPEPTGDLAEERRLREETEARFKALRTQYVEIHNWAKEFLGSYKAGQVAKEKLAALRKVLVLDADKADDAGFDLNVAFLRKQTHGCVQGCASPVAQVLGKDDAWMRLAVDSVGHYSAEDIPANGAGAAYERFSLTAETLAVLLANRRNASYLVSFVRDGTPERQTLNALMNERATIKPPGKLKGQDGLVSYASAQGDGHEERMAAAYLDLAKRMIGCFTPASLGPTVVERLKAFGLWRWSPYGTTIEKLPLDPPFEPLVGSARAAKAHADLLVAEEIVRGPDVEPLAPPFAFAPGAALAEARAELDDEF